MLYHKYQYIDITPPSGMCTVLFPYHPCLLAEVHIFCAKRGVTNLSKMVPSVNRKGGKLMTVVRSMT